MDEANALAWETFKRFSSQVTVGGMDGTILGIRYEPLIAYLKEMGIGGGYLAETLERVQILEMGYVGALSEAREIRAEKQRNSAAAQQALRKAAGQ